MHFFRKTILALSLAAASLSASALTEEEFKAMPVVDGVRFAKAFGVPEIHIAGAFPYENFYQLIMKRVDSNGNHKHPCATLNSIGNGIQGDHEEFSTCKLKDEAEEIKKIVNGELFLIPISFDIDFLGRGKRYTAFKNQQFFQPWENHRYDGRTYDSKILNRYKAPETGRIIAGVRLDFDFDEDTTRIFYKATAREVDPIYGEDMRKYSYDADLDYQSIIVVLQTPYGHSYQEIEINDDIPSPIVYRHLTTKIGESDGSQLLEMNGRAWGVRDSYKKGIPLPADAEGTYDMKSLSDYVIKKGLIK